MRALLLALFILLSIVCIAADDTFTVYIDSTDGSDENGDGSSGNPYASIAGAVAGYNAAVEANTGDPYYNLIIKVKEGTYTGLNNTDYTLPAVNITIQNENNDLNTVYFDCAFATPNAFSANSGVFKIYYINFQNCESGVSVSYPTVADNQDIYLYACNFTNMTNFGVNVQNPSSMSVEESYFSSPAGASYDAYIHVQGDYSSGVDILDCTFTLGTGVFITGMSGGNIVGNSFNNITGPPGNGDSYALYIQGGTWDIKDTDVSYLVSTNYAAFYLINDADNNATANFTIDSCSFSNNLVDDGTIFLLESAGFITDCTFSNNIGAVGGAVFVRGGNVTIQKSTFENNNATLWGGAIDIEETATLFLYDNDFENNYANGTLNSLSCCNLSGATCNATYLVNNKDQGDFSDSNSCPAEITYVSTDEYFETLPSYQYQPFTQPSGSSLWWVWLLVSLALIATIVVVGIAVGAFIYTKKKRSYETFA